MNRDILNKLVKVANSLDDNNFYDEADKVTNIFTKMAQAAPQNQGTQGAGTTATETNPSATTEVGSETQQSGSPNNAQPEGLVYKSGDKIFKVHPSLTQTMEFENETYELRYDDKKNQFWYMPTLKGSKRKPIAVNYKTGQRQENRPARYDAWGRSGLRKLFGDWNLPNLNNLLPLEPIIRNKFVPQISRAVRPVGDAANKVVKPLVIDPLSALGKSVGIKTPNSLDDGEQDAAKVLGTDNESGRVNGGPSPQTKPVAPSTSPPTTTTSAPSTSPPTTTTSAPERVLKNQLKDINDGNALLFWSMALATNTPFDSYDKTKEHLYYNDNTKPKILEVINRLTTNNRYVETRNPNIKNFKNDAIAKLDVIIDRAKKALVGPNSPNTNQPSNAASAPGPNTVSPPTPGTPSTSVSTPPPPGSRIPTGATPPKEANTLNSNNKIILASLNKICNNLESLGAFEEAKTVNNIFFKLAQEEID